MASLICKCTSVLVTITIALTGFGMTLKITQEPKPFNLLQDDQLIINCTDDDKLLYSSHSLDSMYIYRYDYRRPVVNWMFKIDPVLSDEEGTSHMEVDHQLHLRHYNTYLALIIKNPTHEDLGVYNCRMRAEKDITPGHVDRIKVATEAWKLTISPEPQPFHYGLHNDLTLRCQVQGYMQDKELMQIDMMRSDIHTPLVTLKKQDVTLGPNISTNEKGVGEINGTSKESFLTLMIHKPGVEQGGAYKCCMTYIQDNEDLVKKCVTTEDVIGSLSLNMTTAPERYNAIEDNELNITCIVNGTAGWDEAVMRINISKDGRSSPFATYNGSVASVAGIHRKRMKANFHSNITSSKCSLTLVIHKPDAGDAGLYRCELVVLHQNIEKVTTANATFQRSDIRDVVSSFTTRINALERSNMILQNNQSKQTKLMKNLQKGINHLYGFMIESYGNNVRSHVRIEEKKINTLRRAIGCVERGWSFYNGDSTCLKAFETKKHNWKRARRACQNYGADLVQIRDEHKNTFVSNLFKKSKVKSAWMGITNGHPYNYDFTYLDQSLLANYHPWKVIPTKSNTRRKNRCGTLLVKANQKASWTHYNCKRRKQPYVCAISYNGCPAEWPLDTGKKCYRLFGLILSNETEQSWKHARQMCKTYGADLIEIADEDTIGLVARWAVQQRFASNMWIGIHNVNKTHYDFQYVNGSSLGVSNFTDFEPFKNDSKLDCVHLDVGHDYEPYQPGKLKNAMSCHEMLPYVCSKEKSFLPF